MTQFLVILALSIFFICLALAGLALKTLLKKGEHQLSTCSGSGAGNSCGCGTQNSCVSEA
ncbi:hypothetical protein [Natronoflexus pectinivorans]|uniref:hypothetical protein n=1 Tax=Natronoflexus pectinivorans TaxID=682526 RepID=UPI00104C40F3|nr:hypothetical protein [Natronoflexus pectinivorans]